MRIKLVIKSFSWGIVSGIIIGTIAYLTTKNLAGASITALASACIKTPFYSAHEVIFERVWNRRAKRKVNLDVH
jgi:uncharacterized membrane protein